ncbi:MAG: DsbA family protein [Saprospiraceae bacterium]|nr:DsbA family protein [Saprospiraceae bacterium]
MRPNLTYVYDPLCGWCYGFSATIGKLFDNYHEKLDFEVISGGMVIGDREGPIGEVAPYIQDAYRQVEERTGVVFGEAFLNDVLDDGRTYFSSLPPSRALATIKKHAPAEAFRFSGAIQKAIYYDGINPNDPEAYVPYAQTTGVDPQTFLECMKDPETEDLAKQDFHFSRQLQVQGFPAVFVFLNNTYYLIARGYTDYENLERTLNKVLELNG